MGRLVVLSAVILFIPVVSCKRGEKKAEQETEVEELSGADSTDSASGGGESKGNGKGDQTNGAELSVVGTLAIDLNTADTALALPLSKGGDIGSFSSATTAPISPAGSLALELGGDGNGSGNSLALTGWASLNEGNGGGGNGGGGNGGGCGGGGDGCDGGKPEGVLLMVMKDGTDRVAVGESMQFISMPVTTNDSALNLPVGEAIGDSLNLGSIEPGDAGTLATTTQAGTENFSIDETTLKSLAATDDPLRRARNIYMNQDPVTGTYVTNMPVFMFQGRLQAALAATTPSVVWKDPSVTTWNTNYTGYILSFNSNDPRLTLDNICGTAPKVLKLKVPDGQPGIAHASNLAVTYTEQTNAGATKNGSTCESNAGAALYFKTETMMNNGIESSMSGFNWGGGVGFVGRIPTGYWDIMLDTERLARFDLAAAYPMNDDLTPARPIVYIPGLKVTIDPSTRAFVSAQIKLFRWDADLATFVEETDSTAVQRAAKDFTLSLTDYSTTGATWSGQWNRSATASLKFPESGTTFNVTASELSTKSWIVPDENAAGPGDDFASPSVNSVTVNYSMYGVGYMFDYRWYAP